MEDKKEKKNLLEIRAISYRERIAAIDVPTLEKRRKGEDMDLNLFDKVDIDQLFDVEVKGYSKTLSNNRVRKYIKKFFYTNRMVKARNKLRDSKYKKMLTC